nr:hypothetical protein [uncultured Flavobacterium sp.]
MSDIAKQRFITHSLKAVAKEWETTQSREMAARGFENNDWYASRGFTVTESTLEVTHLKKHRFVDMKFRTTKSGNKIKKRNHPIHNRIAFGMYNQLVKELSFGLTENVREKMLNNDKI